MKRIFVALISISLSLLVQSPAEAAVLSASGDAAHLCDVTVSDTTGVTVTRSSNDCILTFTTNNANTTFYDTWTASGATSNIQLFALGGGGGGGQNVGAGGSGGGSYYNASLAVTPGTAVKIKVGRGGAGGISNSSATPSDLYNGQDGETTTVTIGGSTYSGNAGLGGHQAWGSNVCGGTTWANTSRPGGSATGSGGSGGAGGYANYGSGTGSYAGGVGHTNSISGSSIYYGGGGGSGYWGTAVGGTSDNSLVATASSTLVYRGADGGKGGGGAGGSDSTAPAAGFMNRGGGGGGGGAGCVAGAAGGSGVVIIRYTAAAPSHSISVGAIQKNINTTLSATATAPGTVTFYANGRAINRCTNLTIVTTITCTWKPLTSGQTTITSTYTPIDSNFAGTSTSQKTITAKRSVSR